MNSKVPDENLVVEDIVAAVGFFLLGGAASAKRMTSPQ